MTTQTVTERKAMAKEMVIHATEVASYYVTDLGSSFDLEMRDLTTADREALEREVYKQEDRVRRFLGYEPR